MIIHVILNNGGTHMQVSLLWSTCASATHQFDHFQDQDYPQQY